MVQWSTVGVILLSLLTKGVVRIRKSKRTENTVAKRERRTQWPKEKGQMDKQRSTKHYSEK